MSIHIDTFCVILKDTLNVISRKFPDDRDVYFTQSQVEISINVSPRIVIETFLENVRPFEEKIKNKDEKFFLELASSDESLKCFEFGDKWRDFTEEEKELLFRNVQKLVTLARKAM